VQADFVRLQGRSLWQTRLVMMRAELVLPMPGGPLSSTARLVMSLGLPAPFGRPSGGKWLM